MSFLEEYTKLGELGKGGFATVYKVRHNTLGYVRAIKVLHEAVLDEQSHTYKKFIRECKVLLRLGNGSHPNIVHIHKMEISETRAWYEMDFVVGKDLSQYLEGNGYFVSKEEVLRMIEEMSGVLAYCHEDIYKFCMDPDEDRLESDPIDGSKWIIDKPTKERLIEKYKVIHNDIHSGNIMRRDDGTFIMMDFGLAITGDDDVRNSSRHENGAVEYRAPEKWENDKVLTEQSDIYSFGIVMYEYLAGRVPFPYEKSISNKIKAAFMLGEEHKNQTPPSIYDLRKANYEAKNKGKTYEKDYPDWLEEMIMTCLEKDPSKRFRNGKVLHEHIMKHIKEDLDSKDSSQTLSKENQFLKEQNKNLSKENHDLALASLITSVQLHKQVSDFGNHSGQNAKIVGLENQISQLQDENQKLKIRITDLEKNPGGKKRILPIILCVFLGFVAIIMGVLYTNSYGKGKIPNEYTEIMAENANLKQSNEDLTKQVSSLQTRLDSMSDDSGDMAKSQAKINELNDTISDLKQRISNLEKAAAKAKDLEGKLETANSTITSLRKDISSLRKEISEVTRERDALRKVINP